MQRRPASRLGVNGPEEVKQHPWLKGFDWRNLLNKEMKAPFIPSKREENYNSNLKNYNASDEDSPKDRTQLLKMEDVQNFFSGYHFSRERKTVNQTYIPTKTTER